MTATGATGDLTTAFNCAYCGKTKPGLEPVGNGTVARYCGSCGNTFEEFDGTPEERLDAAERAFDLALDDLRNDRFPNPPGDFDRLSDEDKAHLRATLRLGRYDNARFELDAARAALGLPYLTREEEAAR
jgi:hypothetical protein